MQYYIMNGLTHSVVPVSFEQFIQWQNEFGYPSICQQDHVGDLLVSTVFLGIDHDFVDDTTKEDIFYKPLVFETMVIDPQFQSHFQMRYRDYAVALDTHNKIIKHLQFIGHITEDTDINMLNTDDGDII